MTHATWLEDRAVLKVAGADAREFLQGLLTNDVHALAPARPLWAGLLSPQGKALFDLILHDGGDGAVLLDCEAARADELARRLTLYRLRRAVTIERTALHVLAGGEGPPDPRLAALGPRTLAEAPGEPAAAAHRAHRMSLGVPEGAAELGVDKTLWLEANAVELNGVSFTKGCYVGQENTARMHHRDRVRRRLLPLRLTADPGEARAVMAGEREAGELRALSGAIGMAWLRMEHADAPLAIGGAAAAVIWPDWLPRAAPLDEPPAPVASPAAS